MDPRESTYSGGSEPQDTTLGALNPRIHGLRQMKWMSKQPVESHQSDSKKLQGPLHGRKRQPVSRPGARAVRCGHSALCLRVTHTGRQRERPQVILSSLEWSGARDPSTAALYRWQRTLSPRHIIQCTKLLHPGERVDESAERDSLICMTQRRLLRSSRPNLNYGLERSQRGCDSWNGQV